MCKYHECGLHMHKKQTSITKLENFQVPEKVKSKSMARPNREVKGCLNSKRQEEYPPLRSLLWSSSKFSIPLYCMPLISPPGFDRVSWSNPLSITTWNFAFSHKIVTRSQRIEREIHSVLCMVKLHMSFSINQQNFYYFRRLNN